MRFRVESWTRPDSFHIVDLLSRKGAGECDCVDWSTRRWPMIRDGMDPRDDRVACRHVAAARKFLFFEMIEKILTDQPELGG